MVPIEPVVAAEEEIEEFSCQKCKSKFESQLELASHMTNINCNPVMTARCLLCDIEVGSLILYKSHLVGMVSKYNFDNNIFGHTFTFISSTNLIMNYFQIFFYYFY